ncbi:MAG: hypothetical protein PVH88_09500 [Ignavibacteria bacterium]|jgi:GMP synthase (glutamine-hydrolysing)
MKFLIIEHAEHENPGIISDWIEENNFSATTVKPFTGDKLSFENDFDFLLIMGGPQSLIEIDKNPYIKDEIEFTKNIIEEGKYVLGICLGAQIICDAVGSKTVHSEFKEYGFYPVTFTDEALDKPLLKGFPKGLNILHWHGDMPGVNNNATLIGSSAGCSNQGFIYSEKVAWLQFHMEISRKDMDALSKFDEKTLKEESKYVMPIEEIRNHNFDEMNNYMKLLLDNLIKK